MARRIFPESGDRLVYSVSGGDVLAQVGASVGIYTDLACTTLANITDMADVSIPSSILTVGSDSLLPNFKGPDGTPYGVDTLYARPVGSVGDGTQINARSDERLDLDTVIRCTSSTRPTSPVDGQLIYETDTDRLLTYNASLTAWDKFNNATFATLTTLVTADSAATSGTTELTLVTMSAVTVLDSTEVAITALWPATTFTIANDAFELRVYRDGTLIGARNITGSSTVSGGGPGMEIRWFDTPGVAGSYVYSVRVARTAGTGTLVAKASSAKKAYVRVSQA